MKSNLNRHLRGPPPRVIGVKVAQFGIKICDGLLQQMPLISPPLSIFLPSLAVTQSLHLPSLRLLNDLQILSIFCGGMLFEEVHSLVKVLYLCLQQLYLRLQALSPRLWLGWFIHKDLNALIRVKTGRWRTGVFLDKTTMVGSRLA